MHDNPYGGTGLRGAGGLKKLSGQPFDRNAPVAFMHIPRTSGTSLTGGLAATFSPRRPLLHAYDGVLFGTFRSFDAMAPELRRLFYTGGRDFPDDADFIAGHVSFSTLKTKFPGFQHVTFLREPMSRALSHWLFFRGLPNEALAAWEPFSDIIRIADRPLVEFLSDTRIACQADNVCVRMLLWPHPLIKDDGFIEEKDDEALLNEAISRLDLFAYSDVMENPSFHDRLKAWIGSDVLYPRVNETPQAPRLGKANLQRECSVEAMGLLETRTRLDARLWRMLAERRVEITSAETLADYALMQNVIRFAKL